MSSVPNTENPVTGVDLRAHFRSESEALLALAVAPGAGMMPIPSCPGMNVDDIVRHLGSIYTLVTEWITTGSRPVRTPAQGSDSGIVEWAATAARALGSLLDGLNATEPCATWCAADRTAGFWFRRMAHETAVHRIDVAQALDVPWDVDAGLAADGLDEVMQLWLGTQLGSRVNGSGRTVRVVAEDDAAASKRDWLVRPLQSLVDFPRTRTAVACTVSGTPSAVLAWAWGRSDDSHPVAISGDVDAAVELRGLLARAQQ